VRRGGEGREEEAPPAGRRKFWQPAGVVEEEERPILRKISASRALWDI
jgi:hypothetical protein